MTLDPNRRAATNLRRKAQAVLAARALPRGRSHAYDPATLRDELELHRIELELQNETLLLAQQETEATLERYRELYDLAPVGYGTLDRSGKIREANQRAHAIMGIDTPGLVGRQLAAFLDQEDADTLYLHLQAVFTDGASRRWDVVLRNELGQHVAAQIDPPMGKEFCRLALFDHTALQRAEEGLRAAEAKNRVLLDMAADAIVVGDAQGRIESLNRATEKMFGYARDELVGKNLRILLPTSLRRQRERSVERHIFMRAAGIVSAPNRELIGRRNDGTLFPIEVAVGDWWHNGRRKFTAIITDITKRKERETQIRESEERFRQIAEHVTNVFVFHDRASRRASYVSPSFEAIFGRPASDLYEGMERCLAFVHPEDRERVAEVYASLWQGARPDEVFRIQQPDGSVRWIRARVFPVPQPDGRVRSDVCVAEDVTQARELEEKLLQMQKMEAVGTLASSVAHDFNNVLQAILGCLNIARSTETPPEKARQYLDRAAQAAWRGGELASQLMGFARRRRTTPHTLRLDALLMTTKSLLQRLITEGIVLDVHAGARSSYVLADPVQLEQILLNLAANARDAMPHGGMLSVRTEAIELEADHASGLPRGRYVRLVVEDTGTGMDERTRARIFEPFFTTKAIGKGTGLGLATVFATCRQLGGHIDVDSTPGEGTRCTLYFPEVTPARPVSVAPAVAIQLTGKVLLVEDEPLVRTVTRHHLEEIGLEVVEACDANEALEIMLRERGALDALVLDAVLPRISGPKLAAVLRRQHPQLAVLYVSGNPELMNLEGAERDRVAVLRKPFGKEELAASLAKLLVRD